MESSGAVWDSQIADILRIYKEKRKHMFPFLYLLVIYYLPYASVK